MSDGIERSVAETTPTLSELSWPNGLPIAATGSPTVTSAESPSGTGRSSFASGSILRTPTSSYRSKPTTSASARSPSRNSTYARMAWRGWPSSSLSPAVVMTCEFVST